MKLIASADADWGIGRSGELLYHIPDDMRYFREKTTGKTVIMGHATLVSLPGQKPLPNRRNIVLSHVRDLEIDGVEVCSTVNELLAAVGGDETFVIGGESVYRQLLPYCDHAYITRIHARGNADRFLPNLDVERDWTLAVKSPCYEHEGISFEFVEYIRKERL